MGALGSVTDGRQHKAAHPLCLTEAHFAQTAGGLASGCVSKQRSDHNIFLKAFKSVQAQVYCILIIKKGGGDKEPLSIQ